jgi:hypothetical protein
MSPPIARIATFKDAPGYLMANKITGANEALNLLNIPTLMGRDTSDLHFFTDDGVEYLEAAGSLFVSQDNVKPLYVGKKSKSKIQENGHAKWYIVPEQLVGKTLSVNLPEAGSFAVYDANGACLNFSVVSGVNEVVLPANAFIAFIGDPGSQFEISLK